MFIYNYNVELFTKKFFSFFVFIVSAFCFVRFYLNNNNVKERDRERKREKNENCKAYFKATLNEKKKYKNKTNTINNTII